MSKQTHVRSPPSLSSPAQVSGWCPSPLPCTYVGSRNSLTELLSKGSRAHAPTLTCQGYVCPCMCVSAKMAVNNSIPQTSDPAGKKGARPTRRPRRAPGQRAPLCASGLSDTPASGCDWDVQRAYKAGSAFSGSGGNARRGRLGDSSAEKAFLFFCFVCFVFSPGHMGRVIR